MRKINIGAGTEWQHEGWESLDNGSGHYDKSWRHYGVAWETGLPTGVYDVVFASHILEHIPHFRIEKTIAEFNRIMRPGGVLRIAVPDLRKAVDAYMRNDLAFFTEEKYNHAGHLGMGSMLVDFIVSPGHQTLAVMPDFSEAFGGYAHVYSYDFNMMHDLLEKWGFTDISQSSFCESRIDEMREANHIRCGDKKFDIFDKDAKNEVGKNPDYYVAGFDNRPSISLYVEAKKDADKPYSVKKVYPYNRRSAADDKLIRIKMKIFRTISITIDFVYKIYAKTLRR